MQTELQNSHRHPAPGRTTSSLSLPLKHVIYSGDAGETDTSIMEQHSSSSCGSEGHFPAQPRGDLIHRIPSELWGEVFKHYLSEPNIGAPESYTSTPISSLTTKPTTKYNPFLLGHVCRDWSAITIDMPILWSSLAVVLPSKSSFMVPLVSLWLSRTKDCPLTLSLTHNTSNNTPDATVDEILSLFLLRVPQWWRINFVFYGRLDEGVYDKLRHFPAAFAKILESVRFKASGWRHTLTDEVWGQFHLVPNLRRIDSSSPTTYLRSRNSCDVVHWSNLTHIKMCLVFELDVDKFLDVLGHCGELIELDCLIQPPLESPLRPSRVEVPKLRVLKLQVNGNEPGPLLHHIKVPSLVSLGIVHVFDSPRQDTQPRLTYLADLLTRSECVVENFSLYDTELAEDELLKFLSSRMAQSLISLELKTGCYVRDRTIKFLTHAEGQPNCLPNLRQLRLSRCATSEGILSGMFISRSPQLKIQQTRNTPELTFRYGSEYLETPQAVEELRVRLPPDPEATSDNLLLMLYADVPQQ